KSDNSSRCSFNSATVFLALNAPCGATRSALARRLRPGSGTDACQPLSRAVTAAATAARGALPAQVTLVPGVVVPDATRVSVRPVDVTATVARWLELLVLVT